MHMKPLTIWGASAACLSLLIAACGSAAATPAAGSDGTVSVSVGTGTPVKIPKGPLKIGYFSNGNPNQWNSSQIAAVEAEAKKYGYTVSVVNAGGSLNTQLSQMQTAAVDHTYNAAIVQAIQGEPECADMTKVMPAANILVVSSGPDCSSALTNAGDGLWFPGTYATSGGDTSITYARAFFEEAAKEFPGPQQVAVVTGPVGNDLVTSEQDVLSSLAKTNPQFHVAGVVNTGWTAPTALSATESFLEAHPNITVVLSTYSPDVTQGVIDALRALGKLGKVKVADQGGTTYDVSQIQAGNIDFTLPYFPNNYGTYAVDAIHDAQLGRSPQRFISDVPSKYGTLTNPVIITKANVATYTAAY